MKALQVFSVLLWCNFSLMFWAFSQEQGERNMQDNSKYSAVFYKINGEKVDKDVFVGRIKSFNIGGQKSGENFLAPPQRKMTEQEFQKYKEQIETLLVDGRKVPVPKTIKDVPISAGGWEAWYDATDKNTGKKVTYGEIQENFKNKNPIITYEIRDCF